MQAEDRSVFDLEAVPPTSTVSYGNASDQVIDLYLSEKQTKPLVVLIHGGFWRPEFDRKHLSPLAKAIADSGWSVALIEYRRIIGNPDATVQDVYKAIEELTEEFGPTILLGHSAGGHLALLATNQFLPIGLVTLAPVTDLIWAQEKDLDEGAVSDFLGAPAELRNDLNPIKLAAPNTMTLLLHGAKDLRVPIESSRNYVKHLNSDNIEYTEFADLGHFELIDPKHEFYEVLSGKLAMLNDRFNQ
ncbi:MAG: alpha/beta hydrolase [Actinomycetales bacterium]|nr:MAG: alpha/beta hydrolase [Actinomycetales bacterium]